MGQARGNNRHIAKILPKLNTLGASIFFVSFQTIPIRIAIIIIIIITIVISTLQPKEEEEGRRGSFCREDRGVIFLKVTGFVCVFVFMFIFFFDYDTAEAANRQ